MRYPQQVAEGETEFFVSEDFRDGFFGHAIINMSWTRPMGEHGIKYLYHCILLNFLYVLILTTSYKFGLEVHA